MTQTDTSPAAETDYRAAAVGWLTECGHAAEANDVGAIVALLSADPWWRDLYALTWDLVGMHGSEDIAVVLKTALGDNGLHDVALDERIPVSFQRGEYIEALYTFTTDVGLGRGVVRLVAEDGSWKASLVSTSLDGLRGFPEPQVSIDDAAKDEHNLPSAPGARRSVHEIRAERLDFRHADPSVLVIGAGHSGMFLAARLKQLGVPTLMVDTYARAGDNWRLRYNGLLLHDSKWAVQFPYMPFPSTWPLFTPKEMLADWMEAYVNFLDLDLWTSTRVQSATYDDLAKKWTVVLDRDGDHRTLHPNHLVFATGKDGIPHMPTIENMHHFEGTITHSSDHAGGAEVQGKRVVVVGCGASAHDIAQDAYENGAASITMVQRSPVHVFSQRNGIKTLFGGYYSETSPPVEEADLLASSSPLALSLLMSPRPTRAIAQMDREMIARLEEAGFRTTLGPHDGGQVYLGTKGGGSVYIDKGNCQLIIDGDIRIQPGEIERFTPNGVVYRDGTEEEADVVAFCTGYSNMREVARPIVGDEVTDQLATVWNVDERGELRTTLRHSGHEKLWFVANGLRLSRIFTKHVALLIKAVDEGLLDPRVNVEKKQDIIAFPHGSHPGAFSPSAP